MSEADRYRLRPLRDVRARDERVKQGELAGTVGDAAATEAALARASAVTARAQQALDQAVARASRSATAWELAGHERFVARLRAALALALDAQLRAEAAHRGTLDAVAVARGRLAHARAHRELIERHFERWRAERRKVAERRED